MARCSTGAPSTSTWPVSAPRAAGDPAAVAVAAAASAAAAAAVAAVVATAVAVGVAVVATAVAAIAIAGRLTTTRSAPASFRGASLFSQAYPGDVRYRSLPDEVYA